MSRTFLILLVLMLMTAISCVAQHSYFKGYMVYKEGSRTGFGYVVFPVTKDTLDIDSTGWVNVDLKEPAHRIFYVSNGDIKSKVFDFKTAQPLDSTYMITMPDKAYYASYHKKKLCPICLKSSTVLPIEYGLPSPATFKQAKKGRVILGGCIVYDDMPLLYCTKDDFSF